MSRDEEEKEEGILLMLVVVLPLKATPSLRRTMVREGMTACDTQVIGSTPQSDGMSILESATVCRSYE